MGNGESMQRNKVRWLVAGGAALVLLGAGTAVALADDQAPGVGHGFYDGTVPLSTSYNGSVYQTQDLSRGNTAVYCQPTSSDKYCNGATTNTPVLYTDDDNDWGNGKYDNTPSYVVDAEYGWAKAWDYFDQTFGRVGMAGDGKPVNLHFQEYGEAPELSSDGQGGWEVLLGK